MKIAVSILSSNYSEEESVKRVNNTSADYLHVDVMDGHFVLNKTSEYEFLNISNKKLQVHLMVANPFNYISRYSLINTASVIIPIEIDDDINGLLNLIKSNGLRCGLAISPNTSVEKIIPYVELLDDVLVLTVEPGMGGQKMMDSTLYKIDILRKIREERHLNYEITVDGGVNDITVDKVKNADIIVSGSFICRSDDFQSQINKLR